MRTDEITPRDLPPADPRGDIVPLQDDSESATFDTVMRGYNKVQVEDYLDRVEAALTEADQRHAEDGERFVTYEAELASLRERLAMTEQRAAGQPEPASLVGERLARMLSLAEEESAALRASASEEADRILSEARRRAERESAERLADLEVRETEVAAAHETADRLRLEAQTDAETLRATTQRQADDLMDRTERSVAQLTSQAQSEVDALRTQADEYAKRAAEEARAAAATDVEAARLQVRELGRQRDAIAQQMKDLRDQLHAAMGPLGDQQPQ